MSLNTSCNEKYFRQTFLGQIKAHILYSKHLPGIRAVYEVIWENTGEPHNATDGNRVGALVLHIG